MKKVIGLILLLGALSLLWGCGDVSEVQLIDCHSERYSDEELDAAADTVLRYFRKEFSGCTLLSLGYIGDEALEDYGDYAQKNGGDEVIVMVSEFSVDDSGGDGSLNANGHYRGWKWILVRSKGGPWRHADHGYG